MAEAHQSKTIIVLLGNTLHLMEGTLTLTSGADGARCHVAFDEEELGAGAELDLSSGPGGMSGHLRANGVVATLYGDAELVERTFPSDEKEYQFAGLQANFSFPHQGPFRRLRTVFVGVQEAEIVEALIQGWASEEASNVSHLPWTLESLTRFAAAHARSLPEVREVVITGPGELNLRFEQGPHYVNLNNLLQRVRAEPEAALDAIADFFAATTPTEAKVDKAQLMFRVMHATHPVEIQANVGGKVHTTTLASFAVGPDLSAVFVQDTPTNISYLHASDVADLAPDAEALMKRASDNLVRSLPRIHIRGEDHFFMLIAGGDYECSLALVPRLWEAMAPLLPGPPVVAMPSRDLCFITLDDPEAIAGLQEQLDELDELAYPISPKIYRVTKQGRWFEPVA